jgi:hypothetical protein
MADGRHPTNAATNSSTCRNTRAIGTPKTPAHAPIAHRAVAPDGSARVQPGAHAGGCVLNHQAAGRVGAQVAATAR